MNSLKEKIQAYIDDIQATSIENFQDKAANIEMFRVKYLGKKGIISELFEQFKFSIVYKFGFNKIVYRF